MNRKIISAIGWAISSCVFLWLFSLAQAKGLSSPPTYGELFESFILFSFMLLGGGACYHFLTEIIFSPYSSENSYLWIRLSKKMIFLMSILISVPIVVLFSRDNLSLSVAWVVSFFYLLLGLGSALWVGIKIEPVFKAIRSYKSIPMTVDAPADQGVISMVNILVKLNVKDFDAFDRFERQAVLIMGKYKGRIISAFETVRNSDGSGQEIHVLEFPTEEAFGEYRNDTDLANLSDLREKAISGTSVEVSLRIKEYA